MARNPRSPSRKQVEKEFAVIGLGRFGGSLARRLEGMGHTVLGVDSDMARVQEIADDITSAVALDATVEDALQEVDIASFGTVIVGLGDDFEASALVTTYLKGLGIPRVICLAQTRRHRDILLRIGADQVVLSDEDSGRAFGRHARRTRHGRAGAAGCRTQPHRDEGARQLGQPARGGSDPVRCYRAPDPAVGAPHPLSGPRHPAGGG